MSFFSSRSPHTRWPRDWSSDVCCSDLSPTHVDVVAAGVGVPLDNGAEGDRGQLGDAEGVHVGAQRDRSQGGIAAGDVADRSGARHPHRGDRKSTRLNSSHVAISYAVFCLKKKKSRVIKRYVES